MTVSPQGFEIKGLRVHSLTDAPSSVDIELTGPDGQVHAVQTRGNDPFEAVWNGAEQVIQSGATLVRTDVRMRNGHSSVVAILRKGGITARGTYSGSEPMLTVARAYLDALKILARQKATSQPESAAA
jgi:hypothetical protein